MDVVINLALALIGNVMLTISIIPYLAVLIKRNHPVLASCNTEGFKPECFLLHGDIALLVLIIAFNLLHQVVGWFLFMFRLSPPQQSPIKQLSIHVYYQVLLRTFIALTGALVLMFISLLAVYHDMPQRAERAIGITGFLINLTIIIGSVYHCYTEDRTVKTTTATESSLTLDTNQNSTA